MVSKRTEISAEDQRQNAMSKVKNWTLHIVRRRPAAGGRMTAACTRWYPPSTGSKQWIYSICLHLLIDSDNKGICIIYVLCITNVYTNVSMYVRTLNSRVHTCPTILSRIQEYFTRKEFLTNYTLETYDSLIPRAF